MAGNVGWTDTRGDVVESEEDAMGKENEYQSGLVGFCYVRQASR